MNRILGFPGCAGFFLSCACPEAASIRPSAAASVAVHFISCLIVVMSVSHRLTLLKRKYLLPIVLHAHDRPALCLRLVPRLVERADRVLPRTGDLDRPRAPAVIPLLPGGNR